MEVLVVSDIHLEHLNQECVRPMLEGISSIPADTLVLAGDFCSAAMPDRLFESLRYLKEKYRNVVYVAGNHEYYGTHAAAGHATLQEVTGKVGVHFLDYNRVVIDGVTFAGGTMWYPEVPMAKVYNTMVSDSQYIEGLDAFLGESRQRFLQMMEDTDGVDVMVTHHLPSYLSVPVEFRNSPRNMYYVWDVGNRVAYSQIKFWFHGHTHTPCNYTLGGTQVFCSPIGYQNFQNRGTLVTV